MEKKVQKDNKASHRIYQLLLFIMLVVIIALSIYIFQSKDKVLKVSEQYKYIDFSRNFLGQEHYITNIQPLRDKLKDMAEEYGNDDVSIYVEFLNTGANISINPENYVFPASLLKLPVGMVAMKKVENGEWKLNNELVLLEGDADKKSGDQKNLLANEAIGTRFTVENLIKVLLIDSDNTAYKILFRNLSDKELETLIDGIGLEKISDKDGKVSAKEYSRLLRSLYTASYLNRENSQQILEWLDEATFDKFLAASVDPNVPFPHKYGENMKQNVFSDSGIVYIPNRPYIISVMVQGDRHKEYNDKDVERATEFMQAVSKEAYDYFLNYKNNR